MYVLGDVLDAIRDAHEEGVTEGVLVLHPVAYNDLRQATDGLGRPIWHSDGKYLYGYLLRIDPEAELAIELRSTE